MTPHLNCAARLEELRGYTLKLLNVSSYYMLIFVKVCVVKRKINRESGGEQQNSKNRFD